MTEKHTAGPANAPTNPPGEPPSVPDAAYSEKEQQDITAALDRSARGLHGAADKYALDGTWWTAAASITPQLDEAERALTDLQALLTQTGLALRRTRSAARDRFYASPPGTGRPSWPQAGRDADEPQLHPQPYPSADAEARATDDHHHRAPARRSGAAARQARRPARDRGERA